METGVSSMCLICAYHVPSVAWRLEQAMVYWIETSHPALRREREGHAMRVVPEITLSKQVSCRFHGNEGRGQCAAGIPITGTWNRGLQDGRGRGE